MFTHLITFIRHLDPASDFGLTFDPVIDDFSWGQIIDERLQGPTNGCYFVTACAGIAVIGAYGRLSLAIEHLAWERGQSRRLSRVVAYNGWRLRGWVERKARRLRDEILRSARD